MKIRVLDRILVAVAGLILIAACAGLVAQVFFGADVAGHLEVYVARSAGGMELRYLHVAEDDAAVWILDIAVARGGVLRRDVVDGGTHLIIESIENVISQTAHHRAPKPAHENIRGIVLGKVDARPAVEYRPGEERKAQQATTHKPHHEHGDGHGVGSMTGKETKA